MPTEEEMKEFMKRAYPDLVDFDNLQFVKDCREEGANEFREKVKAYLNCLIIRRERTFKGIKNNPVNVTSSHTLKGGASND